MGIRDTLGPELVEIFGIEPKTRRPKRRELPLHHIS